MSNNPSPLPLKNPLPDGIVTAPLILSEPVNFEPNSGEYTSNPLVGSTDALIPPLII